MEKNWKKSVECEIDGCACARVQRTYMDQLMRIFQFISFIRRHEFASNEPEMTYKPNGIIFATIVVAFHFYNCNCGKFSNVSVIVVVWLTGFSFPHFFTWQFSMHRHTYMCFDAPVCHLDWINLWKLNTKKNSLRTYFFFFLNFQNNSIWTEWKFCKHYFNVLIMYLRKPKESNRNILLLRCTSSVNSVWNWPLVGTSEHWFSL